MKKIFCILIALTTFSVGVFSHFLRPIVSPVSLCEATQNAELYQFNNIYIQADLYVVIDGNFLNVLEFGNRCEDANADLWFSEEYDENLPKEKLDDEFLKLINTLSSKSSEDLRAVAEVQIKGKIRKREMACFTLPFYIEVEEIKQVSPIKIINISEEIKKIKSEK